MQQLFNQIDENKKNESCDVLWPLLTVRVEEFSIFESF